MPNLNIDKEKEISISVLFLVTCHSEWVADVASENIYANSR